MPQSGGCCQYEGGGGQKSVVRERPSRLELAESPSVRVSVGEVVKGNAVKIRKSDAVGKVRDVDAELPARDILL